MQPLMFARKQKVYMRADMYDDWSDRRCVGVIFDFNLRKRLLKVLQQVKDSPQR
jgi:hypothetical protein